MNNQPKRESTDNRMMFGPGGRPGGGPGRGGPMAGRMAVQKPKNAGKTILRLIKYIGKSEYSFSIPEDTVSKEVHWYLMMADSYYSKPQREEYFLDSGFYKYHEAIHLLKFSNEKQILEKAYNEYLDLKKSNLWGTHKYY